MDAIHGVFITLGLFILTFLNPGSNLFVVVQTTLTAGRRAGLVCGSGVVLGNAFYSGLGLFGLNALMTRCEGLFAMVKILGGLYLLWYAWTVFRNRHEFSLTATAQAMAGNGWRYFRRGLISDLSNPQTVLFFIGIFSVTLTPQTPLWAKLTTWCGIILASFLWRLFLCQTFSRAAIRRAYSHVHRTVGKVIGVMVSLLAIRLIWQGSRELG